jgi:aminoglycoside phosphotransferase (APT) family kinase protein
METRSQRVPLIKALRHLQSDLLESLRPVRDPVLVHGDLGPGNILVDLSAEPMAMTALVDWEKAGASDPAAEFSSVFLFGFDSEGVRAFCRGYWEKEPMHEVVRERVAYFLIDAIFEAFATTGRRWSPRLDAQAQKAASSLLGGILPDPLGRG